MKNDPYSYGYIPPKQDVLPPGMYSKATQSAVEARPIHAPEGSCDTPENALAMLRANSHIAVNTLTAAAAQGDVKAATAILDKAYPKDAMQVNLQAQNMTVEVKFV